VCLQKIITPRVFYRQEGKKGKQQEKVAPEAGKTKFNKKMLWGLLLAGSRRETPLVVR